ncbi:MAG: ATP-binding cassette domain-containing protein [Gammaproteobacteria bacterium]|nr:ATP-binding cassette domain-containing protein [Gammaproteobacteria bacterium]
MTMADSQIRDHDLHHPAGAQAGAGNDAVTVRDVDFYFGSGDSARRVLHNINLRILRGQIVIMTGPSGSGKTTMLTLIGALRSLQQGSIRCFDTELRGLSLEQQVGVRRNIGFIFQSHNLFESLTARQNVHMALELRTLPEADKHRLADRVLGELGLAERLDYRPGRLSGGQRQRVAIARAVVNTPPLILADEPTAALDKDSGREVIDLLRRLADEQRCTIIIVTHDSRIMDAADRIINLTDGRISSDLDVRRTLYICQFIKQCPVFKDMLLNDLTDVAQHMELQSFAAGSEIIRQGDAGDRFHLIYRGTATVSVRQNGASREVATLNSGDFFGELALLRDEPRNATVSAATDVETFSLSKGQFLAAVRDHKSFEEQMANTMFSRRA